MPKDRLMRIALTSFLAASPTAVSAAAPADRASTPHRYTWNLQELYPSAEAWKAAKDSLVAKAPAVDAFRGTLASSPERLASCLELVFTLNKELARLFSYASMSSDQDTR